MKNDCQMENSNIVFIQWSFHKNKAPRAMFFIPKAFPKSIPVKIQNHFSNLNPLVVDGINFGDLRVVRVGIDVLSFPTSTKWICWIIQSIIRQHKSQSIFQINLTTHISNYFSFFDMSNLGLTTCRIQQCSDGKMTRVIFLRPQLDNNVHFFWNRWTKKQLNVEKSRVDKSKHRIQLK